MPWTLLFLCPFYLSRWNSTRVTIWTTQSTACLWDSPFSSTSLLWTETERYEHRMCSQIQTDQRPPCVLCSSAVTSFFLCPLQSYVLMLYSTLSRSQYDFTLPQVSFTSSGYHKHVTLTFNPTVRWRCFLNPITAGITTYWSHYRALSNRPFLPKLIQHGSHVFVCFPTA